jgi:3',5'-cyclic AMP phosphodiesterase CpdA
MRIAHITDLHLEDFLSQKYRVDTMTNATRLFAHLPSLHVDRVVLGGDLGVEGRHPWIRQSLESLGLPFDLILGNHDEAGALRRAGLLPPSDSDESFYEASLDQTQALFLDSGRGTISQDQLEWLRSRLALASGPAVVFCHHPILDCHPSLDAVLGLKNRTEVGAILRESKRPITLFCGHYHGRHETGAGLVRQSVSPAVIFQIRGEGADIVTDSFDFGFRLVEVRPTEITSQVVMFDSGRAVQPGE